MSNLKDTIEAIEYVQQHYDCTLFNPVGNGIDRLNPIDAEITLFVADRLEVYSSNYENWRNSANI
jgi:hypothetical protein